MSYSAVTCTAPCRWIVSLAEGRNSTFNFHMGLDQGRRQTGRLGRTKAGTRGCLAVDRQWRFATLVESRETPHPGVHGGWPLIGTCEGEEVQGQNIMAAGVDTSSFPSHTQKSPTNLAKGLRGCTVGASCLASILNFVPGQRTHIDIWRCRSTKFRAGEWEVPKRGKPKERCDEGGLERGGAWLRPRMRIL